MFIILKTESEEGKADDQENGGTGGMFEGEENTKTETGEVSQDDVVVSVEAVESVNKIKR